MNIINGDYKDCAGSDIIVIAAGVNQKPGETRIDLARKNKVVFQSIIPQITRYNKDCILLVVTNPVDILTYFTWKLSGFPKSKVIGSGTVLDTARFRYMLAENIGVDSRNIHAYVMGEHGDTEVLTWSLTNVAGISLETYCEMCKGCKDDISKTGMYQDVKNAAYEIIQKKGATYYAVALAVRRIVEAILRDENSILTVSSLLEGEYGIENCCLSVPTLINRNGLERVLEVPIDNSEFELLKKSGASLTSVIKGLE